MDKEVLRPSHHDPQTQSIYNTMPHAAPSPYTPQAAVVTDRDRWRHRKSRLQL